MKLKPRPTFAKLKYTDIISYIAFIVLIPIIIIKIILFALPVGLNLYLSQINDDEESYLIELMIRHTSLLFSYIERFIGWGICILLYGIVPPIRMYIKNKPVMNDFNITRFFDTDFSKIAVIHRYAIEKESFIQIWYKNVIMWSVLPVLKYILGDNPFLFEFRTSFTNQHTREIALNQRTQQNFKKIEMIMHAYMEHSPHTQQLNNVGFIPNFNSVDIDDGKFDSLGMQVPGLFTAYITMGFPKYDEYKVVTFNFKDSEVNDSIKRYRIDHLWVPFIDPWYIISGYVEVNIRETGSIDHPMFGMFNDSLFCEYRWKAIDSLFQGTICKYIEHQIQLADIDFV